MKLIAHRGLINGPDKNLENAPEQIQSALAMGYDCEIDLWVIDHQLFLGHDGPQYPISRDFLEEPGLWIHAKHLDALDWLLTTDLNYFWHQEDDYTLTSHGWIWAYPGKPVTARSVQVVPELVDPSLKNVEWSAHAVCTDWVKLIQAQQPKLET